MTTTRAGNNKTEEEQKSLQEGEVKKWEWGCDRRKQYWAATLGQTQLPPHPPFRVCGRVVRVPKSKFVNEWLEEAAHLLIFFHPSVKLPINTFALHMTTCNDINNNNKYFWGTFKRIQGCPVVIKTILMGVLEGAQHISRCVQVP